MAYFGFFSGFFLLQLCDHRLREGNDPEVTFTIQRATNNTFTENLQEFTGITAGSETYTDSSLAAGTVYYYRIKLVK